MHRSRNAYEIQIASFDKYHVKNLIPEVVLFELNQKYRLKKYIRYEMHDLFMRLPYPVILQERNIEEHDSIK